MKTFHLVSVATALVWIGPALPAQSQDSTDNVVIVLDASGSMKERMAGRQLSKMDAAKAALKTVLKQVPPSTQIGLLVFSAANLKNDWVYPLGPRDDAALFQAIDPIQPGSATPLGRYIKIGADRLLEERAKQFGYGTYRLLIVTDGEAQDQSLVNQYTPEVLSRGITMDVIGVAMRSSHTLATKAHSYRRADDPESLQRAIREVFAEVAGTATDVAQAEAFEMLQPIPSEVATAMIQALSTSGNSPIGVRPRSAPPPERPQTVAPPAAPRPPRSSRPPAPPPQARHSGHTIRFFSLAIPGVMCLGGVVVGIVALVLLTRKGGRR